MPWAANMLLWCVPGFMFISGWFGIKFSFAKVLRLGVVSLYCATVFVLFDNVVSQEMVRMVGSSMILRIWKYATGHWFLNAYVVVMCLAPIVNVAVDRMTLRSHFFPLIYCVFGWSFATTLPHGNLLPQAIGLTSYSFLTLLGIYTLARYLRVHVCQDKVLDRLLGSRWRLLVVIGVGLTFAAIGLGDYNSPFAVAIACSMFFAVKKVELPQRLSALCISLAPSMFSVYMMHSRKFCRGYLVMLEDGLIQRGVPMSIAYFATAAIVFAICVLADLPRRVCAVGITKGIKTVTGFAQNEKRQ